MSEAAIANLVPVILAGGSGTRLWPLSRAESPKHLVNLVGDRSLLQETASRLAEIASLERLIVVGAHNQGDLIRRQLLAMAGELGSRLVLEPVARNTAAAVSLAAQRALESFGKDAIIFVCPSDHLILDRDRLKSAVQIGAKAANSGKLVTFGIEPDRPETGFGYIRRGSEIASAPGALTVAKFVEKPALEVAKAMLADGEHVWNSGMFLMRADVLQAELERYEPQLAADAKAAFASSQDGTIERHLFEKVKSMPVDKAVMERSSDVAVVPCDPKWSDLGSWHALWEIMDKDSDGNGLDGDVLIEESSRNLVKAGTRLVALAGVSDLAVVETADAILVADRSRSELVKAIVGQLSDVGRTEAICHPRQERPWGEIEIIRANGSYCLIELSVDAQQQVQIQSCGPFHFGWVISGEGEVKGGRSGHALSKGQAFDFTQDNETITNTGEEPLVCVLIRLGS